MPVMPSIPRMMEKYTSETGKLIEGANGEQQVTYTGDRLTPEERAHLASDMLYGFDFDVTMLRIGAMNLALHGADAWPDDRLSIHELRPSPVREILLHWPAGRTRSPLAGRAIELAVEVARDLAERM